MGRVMTGDIAASALHGEMRTAPPGSAAGDDAVLTSLGSSQAVRLGEVWSPLLLQKARRGKLQVFVSPFHRTLLTADPLMRALAAAVPGFRATVLPAVMEAGGLTSAEDFAEFDQIEALVKAGKRAEAIAHLKSIQWAPQGLTGDGIQSRFPWADLDAAAHPAVDPELLRSAHGAVPPGSRQWWTRGYESNKLAEARVRAVARWITGPLVANASGGTGDDAVVLVVTHGGFVAQLTNLLLHRAFTGVAEERKEALSTDGIRNTSVTSLFLPSPEYSFVGEFRVHGALEWVAKLELFNDTAHLRSEQLRFWARERLGAKL